MLGGMDNPEGNGYCKAAQRAPWSDCISQHPRHGIAHTSPTKASAGPTLDARQKRTSSVQLLSTWECTSSDPNSPAEGRGALQKHVSPEHKLDDLGLRD